MANRVLPGLYIGDCTHAGDEDALLDLEVTHVLSVGAGVAEKFDDYKYLVLDVLDLDTQDIAQHFDKTFAFIEKARSDGCVLVHCAAGISRSAAVVAAYLMRKLNVSLQDAIDLIKDVRPNVCPNSGFMLQLKRYYYTKLHPELAHEFNQPPAAKTDPQVTADQNPTTQEATTVASTSAAVAVAVEAQPEEAPATPLPNCRFFTCRVCATRLFDETDLVPHESGKHQFQYHKRDKMSEGPSDCTSYFIDSKEWMGDISELQGRIKCPKCSGVVGSWKWDGTQCSCGTWCAPAFQMSKARVDERPAPNSTPAVPTVPADS